MAKRNKPVFTQHEKKSIGSLSMVLFFRMFGLFLVFPIFSVMAANLDGATPALVGLAFGAYGLTQAGLQIPFGILSDRLGRKPVIIGGLILFILGSLLGAASDNIYMMITARLLQGMGAISAVVFATIADLTRSEVRTRASASLGASIGLAFGAAFFLAPFLGAWFSLQQIFLLIAGMALISLIIFAITVPEPQDHHLHISKDSLRQMLGLVLKESNLITINWGAFVCGAGLSIVFFIAPRDLAHHGLEKTELWKVYLPMLLLGGASMVPAAIFAEVKHKFREVMLVGIAMIFLSMLLFSISLYYSSIYITVSALYFFFMGFNVFEPIFPSLVTKLSNQRTKGTASGVYSFSQFIGHFCGALTAGMLYEGRPLLLFIAMFVLILYFLKNTCKLRLAHVS